MSSNLKSRIQEVISKLEAVKLKASENRKISNDLNELNEAAYHRGAVDGLKLAITMLESESES